MKDKPKKPEIITPQKIELPTIPQTNPVLPDLPEIKPEIKKEEPLPVVPEIEPFQPERGPITKPEKKEK
ncbi:MAG: hypothetical protein H0W73_08310 [Bacteroidetes bacterium]|nr:hypothetical protein [Bacteroidota bacterium]